MESAEEDFRDTIHSFVESVHLASTLREKIDISTKPNDSFSIEIEMVPNALVTTEPKPETMETMETMETIYCGIPRDEYTVYL